MGMIDDDDALEVAEALLTSLNKPVVSAGVGAGNKTPKGSVVEVVTVAAVIVVVTTTVLIPRRLILTGDARVREVSARS